MSTILSRVLYALYAAWRHRYLITIPMLTLPIIGLLVGLLSPKHYSSHTSLLIQETAKMNPFLEDFAISAMLKERMDGLKTLLHSRHILGLVAKERGLTDDKTSALEYDEIIAELSNSLKVKKIGMDLIRIDYKSSQPDGMKETLQVISNHFIEQLLAPERSSMKDSSIFLAGHIGTRQKELSKAESELAAFKDKHSNELPDLHLTNLNRLAKLKQRLAEREAEFAGATKSLGGLDLQLSKTNPVVGRIEEQIISIRSELALLRARYTQQHSKVQGAIRNLRRLEEERRHVLAETEHAINIEQLWDIASSARISSEKGTQPLLISQLQNFQMARTKVDSMSEEIISLKKMVSDLEKQTVDYGTHERELLELERKQSFKRQLYEDLLQRYEMARITGSLGLFEQGKRVKIIDRPYTPTAPSNLPLIIFIVAGFFAAIALSIGLTIILETCDTSIRRRDHLETITGVPVLSRIPPLRNLG
ncbi:MAG: hypothetical protein RPT25_07685 [Cycloclasticus sp.]